MKMLETLEKENKIKIITDSTTRQNIQKRNLFLKLPMLFFLFVFIIGGMLFENFLTFFLVGLGISTLVKLGILNYYYEIDDELIVEINDELTLEELLIDYNIEVVSLRTYSLKKK